MRKTVNFLSSLTLMVMLLASCHKSNDLEPNPNPGGGTSPGGSNGDSAKGNSIAFIWRNDTTEASAFKQLMQANKCTVTFVNRTDMATFNYTNFKLIVLGNNSDDTQTIPSFSAADSAAIVNANKPLLLMGVGGFQFGGKLHNAFNYRETYAFNGNTMTVVDPSSSLFTTPKTVLIPANGVIQLFNSSSYIFGYFSASPNIPNTLSIGKIVDGNYNYYTVAVERFRYGMFGYANNVNDMTDAGKNFLVNFVYSVGALQL